MTHSIIIKISKRKIKSLHSYSKKSRNKIPNISNEDQYSLKNIHELDENSNQHSKAKYTQISIEYLQKHGESKIQKLKTKINEQKE